MRWIWNHDFWRGDTQNKMIDTQTRKVKFGHRLRARSKQAAFGVSFVIIYHPKQIMKKLEHLLYQDESVKQVFTPPLIVSYHSARN